MKKAATVLKREKHNIMDRWEAEVNKKIAASENVDSLALRDHLPQLLEDIAQILDNDENSGKFTDEEIRKNILKNSIEHGRHRASTPPYTISHILEEYLIIHRILVEVLANNDAYNEEVGAAIKFTIENSMVYSAEVFNNSLQEMREKLIGILAHDMRNPISAALFAVDIMNPAQGEARFRKLQEMAHNSLKRSLDLIESLLDSVTLGAGEGMVLDFAEGNIVDAISAVYEESLEVYSNPIEMHSTRKNITGVFDATMIRRVVENLLSNAVKYGSRETPVSIWVEDDQDTISLRVHNFGNPIPKERRDNIFKFLDTNLSNGDLEVKSWGMGLTLVRAVAEAHGGKVQVSSSEAEGTSFVISLNKFKNSPGKKRVALNFRG